MGGSGPLGLPVQGLGDGRVVGGPPELGVGGRTLRVPQGFVGGGRRTLGVPPHEHWGGRMMVPPPPRVLGGPGPWGSPREFGGGGGTQGVPS